MSLSPELLKLISRQAEEKYRHIPNNEVWVTSHISAATAWAEKIEVIRAAIEKRVKTYSNRPRFAELEIECNEILTIIDNEINP